MQNLTFKQYVTALTEHNGNCDFIKDPKLRKQCKKLMKKTPGNITYGGGTSSLSGSGSGPGAGTGGGAGPGTGTGGGASGGPSGGGGAAGGGGA